MSAVMTGDTSGSAPAGFDYFAPSLNGDGARDTYLGEPMILDVRPGMRPDAELAGEAAYFSHVGERPRIIDGTRVMFMSGGNTRLGVIGVDDRETSEFEAITQEFVAVHGAEQERLVTDPEAFLWETDTIEPEAVAEEVQTGPRHRRSNRFRSAIRGALMSAVRYSGAHRMQAQVADPEATQPFDTAALAEELRRDEGSETFVGISTVDVLGLPVQPANAKLGQETQRKNRNSSELGFTVHVLGGLAFWNKRARQTFWHSTRDKSVSRFDFTGVLGELPNHMPHLPHRQPKDPESVLPSRPERLKQFAGRVAVGSLGALMAAPGYAAEKSVRAFDRSRDFVNYNFIHTSRARRIGHTAVAALVAGLSYETVHSGMEAWKAAFLPTPQILEYGDNGRPILAQNVPEHHGHIPGNYFPDIHAMGHEILSNALQVGEKAGIMSASLLGLATVAFIAKIVKENRVGRQLVAETDSSWFMDEHSAQTS